ncbi:MAG: Glycosyltransferase involved in cell wall bisynthesis [Candidatus Methanomarinus sp.]|nr:MAG: Glycosyltransferase involved in cell wall bisynthesis [ANME-2 cluster archaeon]
MSDYYNIWIGNNVWKNNGESEREMIPKIVIIHQYGAPKHFLALSYLQEEGYIDKIQSMEFNIPIQIARGIIHRNMKKISRAFYNMKELIKLLFKKNQIIIIGAAPCDPIIPFLQKLKQNNKIIYFTSWPFWDGKIWVKKPFMPKQKDIWYDFLKNVVAVGVTEEVCMEVEKHGSRTFYIPHAVDTNIFRPSLTKSNKIIVLFIGNLSYRKGILVLLDVIRTTKWGHNTEFWFVGDGHFQQQIKRMENEYPVKYFGRISDEQKLASIYREANIFVLPSIDFINGDIENFGIVLIEAMASGLPVITTDSIGPKSIITNNYDGYVIPQNDKDQLKEKIIYLIENPKIMVKMGENGRKTAVNVYDVKKIAERWKNVIDLILE